MPSSRGSSQPRDRNQVSHIAGGFFLSEPPGKPKNIGVGSLSLLQGIFLTQELNKCLLHCRQILYQLSYQGSPYIHIYIYIFRFPSQLDHQRALSRSNSRVVYFITELPWLSRISFLKLKMKNLKICYVYVFPQLLSSSSLYPVQYSFTDYSFQFSVLKLSLKSF